MKICNILSGSFLLLAMSVALSSCTKEPVETAPEKEIVKGEQLFSGQLDPTSRTVPAAGGSVSWTMDDHIGVYDGTNYTMATIKSVSGNSVTFSATVDVEATSYIAVVPYEAATIESFSPEGVRMTAGPATQTVGSQVYSIASSTPGEMSFAFKNVGNIIRFTVEKAGVVKATFKGNNNEWLGGSYVVDPSTGAWKASALDVNLITIPAKAGENFIALGPDVSLPNGFLITLSGEEDDYLGEVPGSKALEMDRNKMANLGVIDGWIDNYQLWEHGKSITIAGKEYSKASTGLAGTLLSANTEDYNLQPVLNKNKGAFFLEQSEGKKFKSTGFIDIGSSSAACDVILVSRFDNAPVTIKPSNRFTLYNGNFYAKGVDFVIRSQDYTVDKSLFQNYTITFGDLHIENCSYSVDSPNVPFLKMSGASNKGIKSIKVIDSKIESLYNGQVNFLYSDGSFINLNEIEEVLFDNNVFYNPYTGGKLQLFASSANKPTNGDQRTVVTINNNTFYNMAPPACFQSYSLGSLTVTNNLFYSASISGTTSIAFSKDTGNLYPYSFDNNFCGGAYTKLSYFNQNNEGAYQGVTAMIPKTAETMFTTANTSEGIFVQAPGFKNCGAHL